MNPTRRGTPDFLLLFLTIGLVIFGVLMVFSASAMKASFDELGPLHYTKRQMISVILGMVAMFFWMNIHYSKLKKWAFPLFIIIFLLLLVVPFVADKQYGARSWIELGAFRLQPAEFAKISIILYLSYYISRKKDKFTEFKQGLLPALIMVLVYVGLIMLQPDFGTAVILLLCSATVIIIGGGNIKHLSLMSLIGLAAIAIVIFNRSHMMDRLHTFFNPWADTSGSGYQMVNSLFAFGNGGLLGLGFGKSIQKLHFLPFAHTDFIFAIIGEELGFVGACLFLLVYLIFLWRGIFVSLRCPDLFGRLLGVGIMSMIGIQAFINLGGVTKTIPLTGVTLPFISYGGSSMLATLIGMGMVLGISRELQLPKSNQKKRQA